MFSTDSYIQVLRHRVNWISKFQNVLIWYKTCIRFAKNNYPYFGNLEINFNDKFYYNSAQLVGKRCLHYNALKPLSSYKNSHSFLKTRKHTLYQWIYKKLSNKPTFFLFIVQFHKTFPWKPTPTHIDKQIIDTQSISYIIWRIFHLVLSSSSSFYCCRQNGESIIQMRLFIKWCNVQHDESYWVAIILTEWMNFI